MKNQENGYERLKRRPLVPCPQCECLLYDDAAYIEGHVEQHTKRLHLNQLFWRIHGVRRGMSAGSGRSPDTEWYDEND